MPKTTQKVRIAAVGDIHVEQYGQNSYQNVFNDVSMHADILLLCGDLTHHGALGDAQALVQMMSSCTIPIVAVLGNHDFHEGNQHQISELLRANRVHVLAGDSVVIQDVGIAGTKGFGGGFGTSMLNSFGEEETKNYVQESVNEAVALENALAKIRDVEKKVVLLHYAPIQKTVEGEPPQIYNHLGCSRLEDPINRYTVSAVFHGHAHNGTHMGKTAKGIPVYNVAFPLLQNSVKPLNFHLFEV